MPAVMQHSWPLAQFTLPHLSGAPVAGVSVVVIVSAGGVPVSVGVVPSVGVLESSPEVSVVVDESAGMPPPVSSSVVAVAPLSSPQPMRANAARTVRMRSFIPRVYRASAFDLTHPGDPRGVFHFLVEIRLHLHPHALRLR